MLAVFNTVLFALFYPDIEKIKNILNKKHIWTISRTNGKLADKNQKKVPLHKIKSSNII